MRRRLFRQAICIILVFSLTGCSSDYVLNLYSKPAGAKVQIGPDVSGRTPCKIEIPKNSNLIKDHHIAVTYMLNDGTKVVKSYDLRDYEPPGSLAVIGGSIFAVPGALLLWFSLPENTNDDSFSDEDNAPYWPGIGIGLGLVGMGALTYYVLGGDSSAKYEYDIHETLEDANNVLIK
jgi:hypothetical protein